MPAVKARPLPENALLRTYIERGAYTDCYAIEIENAVDLGDFIFAFYTTWLFKLERLILQRFFRRPSSDDDAARLARAETESFAAWNLEQRADDQILLSDFHGRTRSWLMIHGIDGKPARTRLYFGSAIVPVDCGGEGEPRLGLGFDLLLGFHKLYSRLLLRAARARLLSAGAGNRQKIDD